jgi:membrane associated rhomboid family serine protease
MNDWDRRTTQRGVGLLSIGIASILTTGFIFSPSLWPTLCLDPSRPTELWRWLSYTIVFEPTDYGYLSFLAILVVSFFFLRNAEAVLGKGRVLAMMLVGALGGSVFYLGIQGLTGSREPMGGESMPIMASILAATSFIASRKSCLYFFLIPMNIRLASFFTLLLLFLHTAAQTRSAAALLPIGAATILGVSVLRALPLLEDLSRRSREVAERRKMEEEVQARRRVDEILEKIHVQGMESLTREELRLLKRASRLLAEHRVER